jgi:hypothetical protein
MESEQNDGRANDISRPSDSEASMVPPIKLSNGTPNARIYLIANMPYSILVFRGLIQVHDQFDGICYKQSNIISNMRLMKKVKHFVPVHYFLITDALCWHYCMAMMKIDLLIGPHANCSSRLTYVGGWQ